MYFILSYSIFILFAQVMHDCRNDSAALQRQFNVTLKNVFDTQVGMSSFTAEYFLWFNNKLLMSYVD